jgi:hypothetical protein
MKRSPIALASLLALSAALAWPQSNSPEPQPASGAPRAPLAGTEANGPKPNSPGAQLAPAMPKATVTGTETNEPVTRNEPFVEPLVPLSPSSSNPVEPPQPKTEILDSSATGSGLSTDGHDPVLDPPPLPTGMTTLVGGTVRAVDHIRNKMTIAVFAGNRWKIAFDERTHVFLNGAETTQLAIKKGERVYVDTMLDPQKHEVFARNIRLGVALPAADADGQIDKVDESNGTVTLRDQINSAPIRFSVDSNTRIVYGANPASVHDLKPGSLIHVRFSPEHSNRGLAREITVLAAPGSAFTYVGRITYLDMHRGVLALENVLDQKNYEIHFDPAHTRSRDDLAVGSEVRVVAVFEGTRYTAQSITLTRSAEAAEKDKE